MALGVPSLIVDYAGPGELVQEGLGFKVPLGTREEIIARFAEQLTELTDQPDLLRETGARAYDHVQNHLTWARKAEQVSEIYQWVLGQGDKPAPFAGVKL